MTQTLDQNHSSARTEADPHTERSASELSDHGIVTVQITSYEWGGYRYSNAADALAAANRAPQ